VLIKAPPSWPATGLTPARAATAFLTAPLTALAAARGHLFPFVPVFLALGIGGYFALPAEPDFGLWAAIGAAGLLLAILAWRGPEALRPLALAAALAALGLAVAGWRAHSVAAPVLDWRYYGPVEGRIVAVDRSVSDALRLTLDQVVLRDLAPARTPDRVRVSIHGDGLDIDPVPGLRVILTAHLGPPGGPVEPGGFDFRRHAWFDRLGAVGYTRSPVLALEPPAEDWALAITRLRMRMSAGLRDRIAGEPGGFVAAILTGDRSGVALETTEALRRSNLAHVLAISGLHMGLLTGVVYGALRGGLALIPLLALRLPIRKIAALGALAAATFYLMLSGGNVATQRAFVMAAVMLGAILLDRRALSLRSVALAAILILLWRPEALLSPGFQMSFAATVALVAVFQTLRKRRARMMAARRPWAERRRLPGWLTGLGGIALCSLVAGLATAPVAAAHFHRMAEYGLLANLLSMPLMGTVVMPGAVIAAALWPVGLEGAGLWMMEMGTRWILGVAHWVSGLEGAVRPVQSPPAWVLPSVALGMLWLILWPGPARAPARWSRSWRWAAGRLPSGPSCWSPRPAG
jgi:competence protein ComEC